MTVPAWFTSRTCAAYRVDDARSRERQARFTCISCGHTDHANTNAAIDIRRRWNTPLRDLGGGCVSCPAKRRPDGTPRSPKILVL
ncbi:zinc ribbon domain-containing protein [Methylobacterium sp. P31]